MASVKVAERASWMPSTPYAMQRGAGADERARGKKSWETPTPGDTMGNVRTLQPQIRHCHDLVVASHCHRAERVEAWLRLSVDSHHLVIRIRFECRAQGIAAGDAVLQAHE